MNPLSLFAKSAPLASPDIAADASPPVKSNFQNTLVEEALRRLPRHCASSVKDMLEIIGPDVAVTVELHSRRLILDAIELLPLEDFTARIGSADKDVRDALAKHKVIGEEIEKLTRRENELATADDCSPRIAAELHGELEAQRSRHARFTPLLTATENLIHTLEEIGRLIAPLARLQTDRTQKLGRWFGSASHPMHSPKAITAADVRSKKILEVADTALTEIKALQRGELPEPFRRNPNGVSSDREHVSLMNISFWI
jgi:hypothetical protein